MKLSNKIGLGLAVLAVTGIVVWLVKRTENKRMLNQIADEGYETAQDILFPDKRMSAQKLHYGPVYPRN